MQIITHYFKKQTTNHLNLILENKRCLEKLTSQLTQSNKAISECYERSFTNRYAALAMSDENRNVPVNEDNNDYDYDVTLSNNRISQLDRC